MEDPIRTHQLRWAGHMMPMVNYRLPNKFRYSRATNILCGYPFCANGKSPHKLCEMRTHLAFINTTRMNHPLENGEEHTLPTTIYKNTSKQKSISTTNESLNLPPPCTIFNINNLDTTTNNNPKKYNFNLGFPPLTHTHTERLVCLSECQQHNG